MKILVLITLSISFSFYSDSDAAFMIGLSYTLKGDIGISVTVLCNDEEDIYVISLGASYHRFAKKMATT